MTALRASILALAVGGLLGTSVHAMSIAEAGPPANMPPAGFEGASFVDARGCIYIKVGRDATPSWVPRVTRDGNVICGLAPTFPEETATESDS